MAQPSPRDLIADIREALDRHPREALVEILTYVFKEYVVEGPAPLATTPPAVRDELQGMSFKEVIQALQLKLDLPELGLFEVQGERVFLKAGGRSIAIEAQASRPEPAPAPLAAPTAPVVPSAPPEPRRDAPPGMTRSSVAVPMTQPRSGAPAASPPPRGGAAAPTTPPSPSPGTSREELPMRAAPSSNSAARTGGSPFGGSPLAPGATPRGASPTSTGAGAARPGAAPGAARPGAPAAPGGGAQPAAGATKEESTAPAGDGRFNLLEID